MRLHLEESSLELSGDQFPGLSKKGQQLRSNLGKLKPEIILQTMQVPFSCSVKLSRT